MITRKEVKEYELYREKIKAREAELLAEISKNKDNWVNHSIDTPFEERIRLDADLRAIQAERQTTKVRLMEMKQELANKKEKTYRQIVEEVLTNPDSNEMYCDDILELINYKYECQLMEDL